MNNVYRVLLFVYLIILLILAFLPLTGYWAALGTLPILGVYLYRRLILETQDGAVVTRRVFLFAFFVFLCGFVLNLFCTMYTTCRMREFRQEIEKSKVRIGIELQETHPEAEQGVPKRAQP